MYIHDPAEHRRAKPPEPPRDADRWRSTPADRIVALQRAAGNRAVTRLVQRVVTLDNPDDIELVPQVVGDQRIKEIVTAVIEERYLPELSQVIAEMTAPEVKLHFRTEAKLRNAVLDRLQTRYVAGVATAAPKLAQLAKAEGAASLAWALKIVHFDVNEAESLLTQLAAVVEPADLAAQVTDVFGNFDGPGSTFGGGVSDWLKGKQNQVDGLLAEMRVVAGIDPGSLAAHSRINMGQKAEAKNPEYGMPVTGPSKRKKPAPKMLSVKVDIRYTDTAGTTWLVEHAEGVDGLRKKVTREPAQRKAYEAVRGEATVPTNLKYICTDGTGWIKLANGDHGGPSPLTVLAGNVWYLELAGQSFTPQQLAIAADKGEKVYKAFKAVDVGKHFLKAWKTLPDLIADDDPAQRFQDATGCQRQDAPAELIT
jgi:hypothetical protein